MCESCISLAFARVAASGPSDKVFPAEIYASGRSAASAVAAREEGVSRIFSYKTSRAARISHVRLKHFARRTVQPARSRIIYTRKPAWSCAAEVRRRRGRRSRRLEKCARRPDRDVSLLLTEKWISMGRANNGAPRPPEARSRPSRGCVRGEGRVYFRDLSLFSVLTSFFVSAGGESCDFACEYFTRLRDFELEVSTE